MLALLLFDFVATERFLGFSKNHVLTKNGVVFAKRELVGGIHGILLGVILTNTGALRNKTDEFALSVAFLCHNKLIIARLEQNVKS